MSGDRPIRVRRSQRIDYLDEFREERAKFREEVDRIAQQKEILDKPPPEESEPIFPEDEPPNFDRDP